jgi:hypothetical protein
MDEQTLKVLARLTMVGELWPVGAWICFVSDNNWYQIKDVDADKYPSQRVRYDHEMSELEANLKGIFKDEWWT